MNLIGTLGVISILIIKQSLMVELDLLLKIHFKLLRIIIEHVQTDELGPWPLEL